MKQGEFGKILRTGFSLAKANFRLRVENSYLGVFWYLLNPLIMFAVLLLVKEAAFPDTEIPSYPLFLLIGISIFNFFKQAITGSISVISENPDYLKSINQVRAESLVLSVVIQAIFSHAFELILIIIAAIYFQASLLGILLYPFIFFSFAILTLGISFIFATIGAYISDLSNIWIILSQLLFLASPIFYSLKTGTLIYYLNLANPLYYFLESSRALIISGQIAYTPIIIILISSIIIMLFGWMIFRKHKSKFAELL